MSNDADIQRSNVKVSFKDRIKNLQKDDKVIDSDNCLEAKQHLIPSTSTSATKPKKTSTTKQLKEKIKSLSYIPKDESTPWSKLKRATVVGLGGSYTSLSNNLTSDYPKLTKTLIKTSMPVNLNVVTNKLNDSTTFFKSLHQSQIKTSSCSPINELDVIVYDQKISVSDSELKRDILSTKESSRSLVKIKSNPKPFKTSKPKSYHSINDLSPEYSGLPFVKKLKILYERQKLEELESAIQTTRSFSLDYTDSSSCSDMIDVLTRSQSEASCMLHSRNVSNTLIPVAPLNFNMHLIPMSQLSPESNETLERKNLKSILKKLSDDRLTQNVANLKSGDRQDMKRLMRAQTLEGYVARRTNFTKSVTFNRTLSSPPTSTLPEEPEESLKTSPLPQHQSFTFPQPHLPSVTPQPTALYPIANEQDDYESSAHVFDPRVQQTSKLSFTESPKLLTTNEHHSQPKLKLSQPNLFDKNISHSDINRSETRALDVLDDNCGERKLVKGICEFSLLLLYIAIKSVNMSQKFSRNHNQKHDILLLDFLWSIKN